MSRDTIPNRLTALPPSIPAESLAVDGDAVVYRLFDVGYEIALNRVLELLATQAPERVRPVRGEAQALQIPNPPITVILGAEAVVLGGERLTVEVSARIFDFGVVSLRARVPAPSHCSWLGFVDFGEQLDAAAVIPSLLDGHLRSLVDRIRSCIDRPAIAQQTEDYIVYRVARLTDAQGVPVLPVCCSTRSSRRCCSTIGAPSVSRRCANSCRTASATQLTIWQSSRGTTR